MSLGTRMFGITTMLHYFLITLRHVSSVKDHSKIVNAGRSEVNLLLLSTVQTVVDVKLVELVSAKVYLKRIND